MNADKLFELENKNKVSDDLGAEIPAEKNALHNKVFLEGQLPVVSILNIFNEYYKKKYNLPSNLSWFHTETMENKIAEFKACQQEYKDRNYYFGKYDPELGKEFKDAKIYHLFVHDKPVYTSTTLMSHFLYLLPLKLKYEEWKIIGE